MAHVEAFFIFQKSVFSHFTYGLTQVSEHCFEAVFERFLLRAHLCFLEGVTYDMARDIGCPCHHAACLMVVRDEASDNTCFKV